MKSISRKKIRENDFTENTKLLTIIRNRIIIIMRWNTIHGWLINGDFVEHHKNGEQNSWLTTN